MRERRWIRSLRFDPSAEDHRVRKSSFLLLLLVTVVFVAAATYAVMTGERTAHAALVASAKSRAAKFGLGKRIGWRD